MEDGFGARFTHFHALARSFALAKYVRSEDDAH